MYESFRTLSSLMICLCLACATHHEAVAACPAIEMSAVADTPTDSTRTVTLKNATTTVLISRTPLVVTGDITGATAAQAEEQWALNFTVTDDAAKRVQEFTGQHVGSNLALVVDGKVYGTPRIASAITGNAYRIDGLNQAEAERMATAIGNGCRR
jgi:preprotein translocase subunit SecD